MMNGSIILLLSVAMVTGNAFHRNIMNDLEELDKRGSATPVGDLKGTALYAHNLVRKNHVDTPPMVWDESLAANAEAYALQLANANIIEHSNSLGNQGENLYRISANKIQPFENAAFFWYREIGLFDYSAPYLYNVYGAAGVGHFTQMVWVTSKRVGCAGAKIQNGRTITSYYVCRYTPAGNRLGQFATMVRPVIDASKIPKSTLTYKPPTNTGCKDLNPAYCGAMTKQNCDAPAFKVFNRGQCPKSCQVC